MRTHEHDRRPETERVARRPEQPLHDVLALQRSAGNQAVTRMLGRAPRLLQRVDEIAQFSGTVVKEAIDKQSELDDEVEQVLDSHFDGHQALVLQGKYSTVASWTQFIYDYMEERYSGIDAAMVEEAIRTVKDKYRATDLLHLANTFLYEAEDREDHIYGLQSGEDLGDFLRHRGAWIDEDDEGVLTAIFESEGKRTSPAFTPPAGHVVVYDDEDGDDIVVMLDEHQNKHQATNIHGIPVYSGAPGTKFGFEADLAWHEENTAMVVRDTVSAAIESGTVTKTKAYSPPKTPIDGFGYRIKYDLTITYDDDTAKYIGSYHCNPV
jgi:hypothetical protein